MALLVIGRCKASSNDGMLFMTSRIWFDLASMRVIRFERLFRNDGKMLGYDAIESVSFKRAAS